PDTFTIMPSPPRPTFLPYTTLFRSARRPGAPAAHYGVKPTIGCGKDWQVIVCSARSIVLKCQETTNRGRYGRPLDPGQPGRGDQGGRRDPRSPQQGGRGTPRSRAAR